MFVISRRHLIAGAASAALAQTQEKKQISKVVIAGGHPGDPEYGCGGTAARFSDLGCEVTMLYLNRGEGNCPAQPNEQPNASGCATRTAEAEKACAILKARPKFATQYDGRAIVDSDHYDSFYRIIEALAPDILFTQWPLDHHRDHRATFQLCYDAWFRSSKKFALFFYEVSDGEDTFMFAPTRYVDITSVESRKRAACYAHASQTPDRFYKLQSEVARFRGLESGFSQAEAFIEHIGGPKVLLP